MYVNIVRCAYLSFVVSAFSVQNQDIECKTPSFHLIRYYNSISY